MGGVIYVGPSLFDVPTVFATFVFLLFPGRALPPPPGAVSSLSGWCEFPASI